MNRRRMLGMMAATACATLCSPAIGAQGRRIERFGLQLYTVRSLLDDDVPGTLAKIAAAGYSEVETAGYADLEPAQFAAALQQAGLSAPSAHVSLAQIREQAAALIESATVLGHRYLVLPYLLPWQRLSLDAWRGIADTLNAFGEQCAVAGIQLAYHNHDFEFESDDGQRPYDLLLERCDATRVKFEMDLYWATKAGADPAAYLRAAPERFPLCHVKDMTTDGDMVAVGDGSIDFAALFTAGSGLRHYFVEHDRPDDPLDSIRRSAAAIRGMRF